ncbi:MAG: glycoside hydrolase family 16 protein [Bacteroidetes bacterium]|nr:glycoside hydrolase family 16 protein [Bacteroidota bacterium]
MKNNSKLIVSAAICSLLFIALSGCKKDDTQKLEQRNWELVWSDEFNGSAGELPDSAKWQFDIGNGPNNDGWGNAELEYYTNRPVNASIDSNGYLALTARSELYSGSAFTSARIKTMSLFEQSYGRFEARIKTPWGPGIWPAFWLLGSDVNTTGWPQCGEIDIMELRGQKPNIINGTLHGPGYSGAGGITKSFAFENARFDVDFHLFAVEWGEDYIDLFVDGTLYQQLTPDNVTGNWVFNHPFFIILNVAVGGNYVGYPTSQTPFPQTMLVDYVRVYKEVK